METIRKAATYYDVLSVPRDADADAIQKAFKKCALKCHPDKNPAPGAEEAFKRVAAAVEVLSDPEKRAHYDRYGEEDRSSGGPTNGGAGGGHGHGRGGGGMRYARYEDSADFDAEHIFNMFFGGMGGMGGGGMGATHVYTDGHGRTFRVRRGGPPPGMRRQHAAAQAEGDDGSGQARAVQLMHFLPMLMLALVALLTFFSGSGGSAAERLYSLDEDPKLGFSVKRTTKSMGVTHHLPYYVRSDFDQRLAYAGVPLQRVERAVADDTYTLLSRRCAEEETKVRTLVQKAKYAKGAAKAEAEHMLKEPNVKKSCDLKQRLFNERY